MANEVKIKVSADTEKAKAQLRGLGDRATGAADKLRGMKGPLLGIAGAAIGGLGVAVKLAEDERIGIEKLTVALDNAGVSYAEQEDAINKVIEAQQRKTNFGDEVQREALTQLIGVTDSYSLSMEALPAVLDLAAASGMDLERASLLVGRAISGEATALKRYGVNLDSTATSTEVLTALTDKFGGQAEASASPIIQLKNRMGDMAQVIGHVLLPIINAIAVGIELMVRGFTVLPGPVGTVVAVIGVLAGGLAVLGLVLPPLITLFKSMKAIMMAVRTAALLSWGAVLSPAVLVVAGIAAVVIAGILLLKNWDKISGVARTVFTFVLEKIQEMANGAIFAINILIKGINAILEFLGKDTIQELKRWEFDANEIFDKLETGITGFIESTEQKIGELKEEVLGAGDSFTEMADKAMGAGSTLSDEFRKAGDEATFMGEAMMQASASGSDAIVSVGDKATFMGDAMMQAGASDASAIESLTALAKVPTPKLGELDPWGGMKDEFDELEQLKAGMSTATTGLPGPLLGVGDPGGLSLPTGYTTKPVGGLVSGISGMGATKPMFATSGGYTVNLYVQGDVYGMDDLDSHIKKTVKEAFQEGGFHGVPALTGS